MMTLILMVTMPNDDDDCDFDDRDLGDGQCNHESDVEAIFGFSKEDFRPSHSSHHHTMLPEDDEFFEEIVFSRYNVRNFSFPIAF